MRELNTIEVEEVNGGFWNGLAVAITILYAASDVYEGFSDHRK